MASDVMDYSVRGEIEKLHNNLQNYKDPNQANVAQMKVKKSRQSSRADAIPEEESMPSVDINESGHDLESEANPMTVRTGQS